jgi:hypothetical protein
VIDEEAARLESKRDVFLFHVRPISMAQLVLLPLASTALIVAFIVVVSRNGDWRGIRLLMEGASLFVLFLLNWWLHFNWYRFEVCSLHRPTSVSISYSLLLLLVSVYLSIWLSGYLYVLLL